MDDWLKATAGDLGRAIAAGRIDPAAMVEAFLDAIARQPDAARIYAHTTPERARAEASAAAERARQGRRRHPLDGVPISWKDLFDSAGAPTEGGSALLKGRIPGTDATLLAEATARGSVCLGKTHLSELAFSGLGLNPVTATPPNIHGPGLVPGGSSSGAAASVAFGLAAAAVGTDTGGSVRIPAAWNDLVGLRTTPGLLPMTGALPLAPSFDTAGPIARTVEDAGLVLSLLSGGQAPDLAGATLSGARLLVLETAALDGLRPEPVAAFDTARQRLAAAGATLTALRLPAVAEALDLSAVLFTTEAWAAWAATIETAPEKMFPPILERFRSGAVFSSAQAAAARTRLGELRALWAAATGGADAVILPTAANMPPDMARLLADPAYYAAENLLTLRNTRIANLMGLPALTLPTGAPACGLMLCAPPFAEARLLRLGAAAERALAG